MVFKKCPNTVSGMYEAGPWSSDRYGEYCILGLVTATNIHTDFIGSVTVRQLLKEALIESTSFQVYSDKSVSRRSG